MSNTVHAPQARFTHDGRLHVRCWCAHTTVKATPQEIRQGLTRACNRWDCHQPRPR